MKTSDTTVASNIQASAGNESNITLRKRSIRSNPEYTTTTPSIVRNNFNASLIINDQIADLSIESNDNFEETRNRIVCYVPNWSRYRESVAKFDVSFILPDLCTHLIYAFANVINNSVVPSDYYADIDQMGYVNFNKIKFKNPKIKTLISVNQNPKSNDSSYSAIVNNPERRQEFIENVLNFLKMHNFDGVDIHWQYPGEISTDKENFAQFLKEINAKFLEDAIVSKTPKLLLTITIPSEKSYLDRGYDIPKINDFVDWFNLFSFNYHTSSESKVNHHAPLYSLGGIDESENNVNASVFNYIESGIDRSKLVVGIPTYGISYTLANESLTDINSPAAGPGIRGELSGFVGSLPFYEICEKIFNPESEWIEVQEMAPYAFKGNRWIAYDDEETVQYKAEYVVDNSLGGVMFWSIDQDDFRDLCRGGVQFPLIQAAKTIFGIKLNYPPDAQGPGGPKGPKGPTGPKGSPGPPGKFSEKTTLDFMCSETGLFPNPRNCRTYYACIDVYAYNKGYKIGIRLILLTCSEGAYFNREKRDCTFIDSKNYCIEQNEYDNELKVSLAGNYRSKTESIIDSKFPMIIETSSLPNSKVCADGSSSSPTQENIDTNRISKLIKNSGGFEKFEQFLKLYLSTSVDSQTKQAVIMPFPTNEVLLPISERAAITNTEIKKFMSNTQIKLNENTNEAIQSQFEIPKTDVNQLASHTDHTYEIKEIHIHNINIYNIK